MWWALEAVLEVRIEGGEPLNLMANRPSRSAVMTFARRMGAIYHDVPLEPRHLSGWSSGVWSAEHGRAARRRRSLVHIRTVDAYIRRLRDWLECFRGVATKYLPNYLVWHRLVDAGVRNGFQSVLLRWPSRQVTGARR